MDGSVAKKLRLVAGDGKDNNVNLVSAFHSLAYGWAQVKVSTVQTCSYHADTM